ncbi:MAG: potassium-transporting ATPase subunit KdpC [Polyangiaceae bacterium]|jgi:K+-transporting ATPase ATPase C chain
MISQLRASVVSFALLTVLTGLVYPLLVTAVAQAAFPHEARGSVIVRRGQAVGSSLIGQAFDAPRYFWGRLSATVDSNGKPLAYNAGASGGSNLSSTNPALADAARVRVDALRAASPLSAWSTVPVDLVTSSASGLDPDISPAAAEIQVQRVATARGLDPARVRRLVQAHTRDRTLAILGEPRVNVLELNLALDDEK